MNELYGERLREQHVEPELSDDEFAFEPGEFEHLLAVGSAIATGIAELDDAIDVWLDHDPVYAHCLLSKQDYLYYERIGEIELDADTGYPVYVGDERLRGGGVA